MMPSLERSESAPIMAKNNNSSSSSNSAAATPSVPGTAPDSPSTPPATNAREFSPAKQRFFAHVAKKSNHMMVLQAQALLDAHHRSELPAGCTLVERTHNLSLYQAQAISTQRQAQRQALRRGTISSTSMTSNCRRVAPSAHAKAKAKASPPVRLVAVSRVRGTMDEYMHAFRDSLRPMSQTTTDHQLGEAQRGETLLHPDVLDQCSMYTLREDRTQKLGVKWVVMQTPWSAVGSQSRKRDFVLLGGAEAFHTRGQHSRRRGWVECWHSVDLPWMPSREKTLGFVRGSVYQTGMVVMESRESSEWLDVVCTVEMDMKGHANAKHQRAVANRRMRCIPAMQKEIDAARKELQKAIPLLGDARDSNDNNGSVPSRDGLRHCLSCTQRVGFGLCKPNRLTAWFQLHCDQCQRTMCSNCSHVAQEHGKRRYRRLCPACYSDSQPSPRSDEESPRPRMAAGEQSMQQERRPKRSYTFTGDNLLRRAQANAAVAAVDAARSRAKPQVLELPAKPKPEQTTTRPRSRTNDFKPRVVLYPTTAEAAPATRAPPRSLRCQTLLYQCDSLPEVSEEPEEVLLQQSDKNEDTSGRGSALIVQVRSGKCVM